MMNKLLTVITALLAIFHATAASFADNSHDAMIRIEKQNFKILAGYPTQTIELSYLQYYKSDSNAQGDVPAVTYQHSKLIAKLGNKVVTKTITNAEETIVFDRDFPTENRNVIMQIGNHVITVPASTNTVTVHPESFDKVHFAPP
ncbi:hypothetical protein BGW37DRAFT_466957 [Umbelopsis sp. PMI_123]|nr:hypothetical protein BGW37DRAFT_466957 [Umbelopsis sp. PMI_123]